MKLITAHARQGAGGGANLRGKVREGGDIVPIQRYRIGELAPGDLHAVAGVAGKADYCLVDLFAPVLGERRFNKCGHMLPDPWKSPSITPPPGGMRLGLHI